MMNMQAEYIAVEEIRYHNGMARVVTFRKLPVSGGLDELRFYLPYEFKMQAKDMDVQLGEVVTLTMEKRNEG